MQQFINFGQQYMLAQDFARFSPDGRHFVIVTQRGIVDSDELQARIWEFDTNEVRQYVIAGVKSGVSAPTPHLLAQLTARTPLNMQMPTPTVSHLQWTEDGTSLVFVGRSRTAEGHVYELNVATGALKQLTPNGQDVVDYTRASGILAYIVLPPFTPSPPPFERVLTGSSILETLFPREWNTYPPNHWELGVVRNGEPELVLDSQTHLPVRLNYNSIVTASQLSISPDGRNIIFPRAVSTIPAQWQSYTPDVPTMRLKATTPLSSPPIAWESAEVLNMINLDTGIRSTLLKAPLAVSLSYTVQTPITWSENGRQVLIPDTFLPLAGVSEAERLRRIARPAIVLYDIGTHQITEIAPDESSNYVSRNGQALDTIRWDEAQRRVFVHYNYKRSGYAQQNSGFTQIYQFNGTTWVFAGQHLDNPSLRKVVLNSPTNTPVRISIQQGLNSPPMLFATISGRGRVLWNPNPQLSDISLGTASLYSWRDGHGHRLEGILMKPPDYIAGKRYPLVIQAHGYDFDPNQFIGTGETCVGYGCVFTGFVGRAMAAKGFLVLQTPGLDVSIFTPHDALLQAQAYQALVKKLSDEGLIDPRRVGYIAWSYTGYYALYIMGRFPKLFAAVSITEGTNYDIWNALASVDDTFFTQMVDVMGGQLPFGWGLRGWVENSPFFHYDKVIAPLRILEFGNTSALENWSMYAGLRALNKPVDIIDYANGSHVLVQPREELTAIEENIDWFNFWLEHREDPAPSKAAQYRRWEALRELLK